MAETSQPLVFGDYVVERELGRGGMGVVYAATHAELGKRVAIKVLLPEVSRDTELVERFKNEAKTASSIEHPSIVEIHTVGHEAGAVYIVMELLQGESLAARLKARGALAIADAIGIGRQCANALDAAHRVGIVHRDLKPDNVFLVPDGEVPGGERVKLLDFGIAKLIGDTHASVARTVTGAILGTPHYMSPEQCEGAREVDARSDLYSLGCMVFQMVTGRLPFESAGIGGLIGMHLHVPPPTLRSIRPDLPHELDALVSRLLAKAPEARPQTATEVAAALRDLAGRPSVSTLAPPPPPSIVEVGAATMVTIAPSPAPSRERPTRRRLVAAGVGVVIAAGAIGFVLARGGRSPDEDTVPPALPVPDAGVVALAPAEPPVVQPARRASETPRSSSRDVDLDLVEQLVANDELDGAERQLEKVRARSPDNPAIRELDAAIRAGRATLALQAMQRAARARRYDQVRRYLQQVRATGVADRIATANQRWRELAPEISASVRREVADLVAKGSCGEARTAAKLGQELGESYDKLLTECTRRAALAAYREERTAKILRRIDTIGTPAGVTIECTNLLGEAPDRMPWSVCVRAACSTNNTVAQTYIMRSPPELRQNLMEACPPTPH